jgi:hypothetical protein
MSGELPDEFWTKEFYSAADIGKVLGVHFSKVWRIVGQILGLNRQPGIGK